MSTMVNKLVISNLNLPLAHENDLLLAINSLVSLVSLELNDVLTQIPSRAFEMKSEEKRFPQFRLKSIKISSPEHKRALTKIGSYAFYELAKLEKLILFNNKISRIEKYAFARRIDSTNNGTFIIDLSKNDLTALSFELGALAGIKGNVIQLVLGSLFVGCNREMKYLPESIFSPFLDKSNTELIIGCSTPMNCDCKMKWLYDSPIEWRSKITGGLYGEFVDVLCRVEAIDEDVDEDITEISLWELKEEHFNCDGQSGKEEAHEAEIGKFFQDLWFF
jgi:hypothetical protein